MSEELSIEEAERWKLRRQVRELEGKLQEYQKAIEQGDPTWLLTSLRQIPSRLGFIDPDLETAIQQMADALTEAIDERDELRREVQRQRQIMTLLGAQCLRLYRWLVRVRAARL